MHEFLGKYGRILVGLATAVLVLIAVDIVLRALHQPGSGPPIGTVMPDTPPVEFLYLDTARVVSYLGELREGLSDNEKRTLSGTNSAEAKLNTGLVAEVSGSVERGYATEATVSPEASDRFLSLLSTLQAHSRYQDVRKRWLRDIDVLALRDKPRRNQDRYFNALLHSLREGHFVRLRNAHLYLPPWAAIVPRGRAAALLTKRGFEPRETVAERVERLPRAVVRSILRALGPSPQLPFVIPVRLGHNEPVAARIFVPSGYQALTGNPRVLAANPTVVGKILYVERRRSDSPDCHVKTRLPCSYTDPASVGIFGRALDEAPLLARRLLTDGSRTGTAAVRRSMTFEGRFMIVLPLAIYQ